MMKKLSTYEGLRINVKGADKAPTSPYGTCQATRNIC